MPTSRRPRVLRSGRELPLPPAPPVEDPTAPASDAPASSVPDSNEPERARVNGHANAKVTVVPLDDTGPQAIVLPLAKSGARPKRMRFGSAGGYAPGTGSGAEGSAMDGPASDGEVPDAPVGTHAGAEAGATVLRFPVPAAKRRRLRLWTAIGSVAAAVALVVALAIYSPLLALKTITVDGNKLAGTDTVLATLQPMLGKPLPQVDENSVQKLLSALPQVSTATIEARPPQTLLVHIVERQPVALLKEGDSFLMVDPTGVVLGSATDQSTFALPLIDGGKAVIGNKNFTAITAVLAVLPTSVLGRLEHASASSPDAVELKLNDGKTVIWGNDSENELKAKALDALLNSPLPPVAAGKPERPAVTVYDVSTPRHPVTR